MPNAEDIESGVGGYVTADNGGRLEVGKWSLDRIFYNAPVCHSGSGAVDMNKRLGEGYKVFMEGPFTPSQNAATRFGGATPVSVSLTRTKNVGSFTGKMLMQGFHFECISEQKGGSTPVGSEVRWSATFVCAGALTIVADVGTALGIV